MPGVSGSPTAALADPAAWRSRSRTPPPRRPAGSRSPASPLRCATCPERRPAGAQRHSQADRPPTRSARTAALDRGSEPSGLTPATEAAHAHSDVGVARLLTSAGDVAHGGGPTMDVRRTGRIFGWLFIGTFVTSIP